jgi:hypothetical protein
MAGLFWNNHGDGVGNDQTIIRLAKDLISLFSTV